MNDKLHIVFQVPQLMVQSSYPDDRPTDFAKKYQIIDKRQ